MEAHSLMWMVLNKNWKIMHREKQYVQEYEPETYVKERPRPDNT